MLQLPKMRFILYTNPNSEFGEDDEIAKDLEAKYESPDPDCAGTCALNMYFERPEADGNKYRTALASIEGYRNDAVILRANITAIMERLKELELWSGDIPVSDSKAVSKNGKESYYSHGQTNVRLPEEYDEWVSEFKEKAILNDRNLCDYEQKSFPLRVETGYLVIDLNGQVKASPDSDVKVDSFDISLKEFNAIELSMDAAAASVDEIPSMTEKAKGILEQHFGGSKVTAPRKNSAPKESSTASTASAKTNTPSVGRRGR